MVRSLAFKVGFWLITFGIHLHCLWLATFTREFGERQLGRGGVVFKKNVSWTVCCDTLKSLFVAWHIYKHNAVVVSFCQLDTKLDLLGKRDSQLTNGLQRWACRHVFGALSPSLIDVKEPNLLWVLPTLGREACTGQLSNLQGRGRNLLFLVQFQLGFPPWRTIKRKANKPALPQVVFSHGDKY